MLRTEKWQDQVLMVIPSINGGDLLTRMLPTLRFKPANVVVLDQGSTDQTATVCAAASVELMQLGRPHSYTEACNIGARLAAERGCNYLCVANNDIVFRTDVLAEMWAAMERDPSLGIVAPSQIIIDPASDNHALAYRVVWELDTVDFKHDVDPVDWGTERLEADFCELTCALVRMSVIESIGFLDDTYGFYHEDADFGFRLRKSGYGCAYLPGSQIDHYSGSTFNREKLVRKANYIVENKMYFARKHLGYGVRHREDEGPGNGTESDRLDRSTHHYLWRYGLLDRRKPELVVSYPGADVAGYLMTTFQGPHVPARWAEFNSKYQAIFTISARMQALFAQAGITNSFHVPLGVETDIFHPWGSARRAYDETTYLAVVDARQDRLLQVILDAWQRFAAACPDMRLILVGRGLIDGLSAWLGRPADLLCRDDNFDVGRYKEERIDLYEILASACDEALALLYRSVDYTLIGPAGDGSSLAMLETLACGVPCIFGDQGLPEAALLRGVYSPADATPRPADAVALLVADRPRTVVDHIVACLHESRGLTAADRAGLAAEGVRRVRSRGTLRHTAMGLYSALTQLQTQDPAPFLKTLQRNRSALVYAVMNAGVTGGPDTVTGRLADLTARRVQGVGNLTVEFATNWQERGFGAARRGAADRLSAFLGRRSERVSLLGQDMAKRVRSKATRTLQPLLATGRPKPDSALLIAYIDAQLGLGQSSRGLALAMTETEVPFAIYPFGVGVEGRRGEPYMPERYDTEQAHAVNIIEVTAGELATVYAHISPVHFNRSYNVLRTYWELGKAPEAWRAHLQGIDEIWAPTRFVAESFRSIFDRPITVIPPCIEPPVAPLDGRRHFGMQDKRFYFLFSFDYFSFPQRKNPLGVVRAFRAAFPDPSADVGLVVKSTGSVAHFPQIREALRAAAREDPRIEIVDESLPRADMLALMQAADCYVSLHRSEGFGLGMAEAMALGKPVIGTDYSGNTDFLTAETGFPVRCTLRPVAPDEYIHTEGQVWAEPDEADCADAMRRVVTDRDGTRSRTEAGRRLVLDYFGAASVGRMVRERLQAIAALRAAGAGRSRRRAPS